MIRGDFSSLSGGRFLAAHLLPAAGLAEPQRTNNAAMTATHSMRFSRRLASQRMLSNRTALNLPATHSRGWPGAVIDDGLPSVTPQCNSRPSTARWPPGQDAAGARAADAAGGAERAEDVAPDRCGAQPEARDHVVGGLRRGAYHRGDRDQVEASPPGQLAQHNQAKPAFVCL